jgi:hypothetical protein
MKNNDDFLAFIKVKSNKVTFGPNIYYGGKGKNDCENDCENVGEYEVEDDGDCCCFLFSMCCISVETFAILTYI